MLVTAAARIGAMRKRRSSMPKIVRRELIDAVHVPKSRLFHYVEDDDWLTKPFSDRLPISSSDAVPSTAAAIR